VSLRVLLSHPLKATETTQFLPVVWQQAAVSTAVRLTAFLGRLRPHWKEFRDSQTEKGCKLQRAVAVLLSCPRRWKWRRRGIVVCRREVQWELFTAYSLGTRKRTHTIFGSGTWSSLFCQHPETSQRMSGPFLPCCACRWRCLHCSCRL